MTLYVGRLTSEVTVHDADAGISPGQAERIVAMVIARLEERAREARRSHAATSISRQASKPLGPGH